MSTTAETGSPRLRTPTSVQRIDTQPAAHAPMMVPLQPSTPPADEIASTQPRTRFSLFASSPKPEGTITCDCSALGWKICLRRDTSEANVKESERNLHRLSRNNANLPHPAVLPYTVGLGFHLGPNNPYPPSFVPPEEGEGYPNAVPLGPIRMHRPNAPYMPPSLAHPYYQPASDIDPAIDPLTTHASVPYFPSSGDSLDAPPWHSRCEEQHPDRQPLARLTRNRFLDDQQPATASDPNVGHWQVAQDALKGADVERTRAALSRYLRATQKISAHGPNSPPRQGPGGVWQRADASSTHRTKAGSGYPPRPEIVRASEEDPFASSSPAILQPGVRSETLSPRTATTRRADSSDDEWLQAAPPIRGGFEKWKFPPSQALNRNQPRLTLSSSPIFSKWSPSQVDDEVSDPEDLAMSPETRRPGTQLPGTSEKTLMPTSDPRTPLLSSNDTVPDLARTCEVGMSRMLTACPPERGEQNDTALSRMSTARPAERAPQNYISSQSDINPTRKREAEGDDEEEESPEAIAKRRAAKGKGVDPRERGAHWRPRVPYSQYHSPLPAATSERKTPRWSNTFNPYPPIGIPISQRQIQQREPSSASRLYQQGENVNIHEQGPVQRVQRVQLEEESELVGSAATLYKQKSGITSRSGISAPPTTTATMTSPQSTTPPRYPRSPLSPRARSREPERGERRTPVWSEGMTDPQYPQATPK